MDQTQKQRTILLLGSNSELVQNTLAELKNQEPKVEEFEKICNVEAYTPGAKWDPLELHSKLSLYEFAIMVIDNFDLELQDEIKEQGQGPCNHTYIQMLHMLQYKQVMVLIESDEYKASSKVQKEQQEKWILDEVSAIWSGSKLEDQLERNPFKIPLPQLKVVSKLDQKDIVNHFKPTVGNPNRFLYVRVIKGDKKQATVKILTGFVTQGSLLHFLPDIKLVVEEILLNEKQVNFAQAGDIVILKFVTAANAAVSGIGHGNNQSRSVFKKSSFDILLHRLEAESTHKKLNKLIKGSFITYFGQKLKFEKFNVLGQVIMDGTIIQPNHKQRKVLFRVEFEITPQAQIYMPNSDGIFLILNQNDKAIFAYARPINPVLTVTQVPPNYNFRLILPSFPQKVPELMKLANRDLRPLCRICKEAPFDTLLLSCGHLRYCSDCSDQCIENKICFYCEKEGTQKKRLQIIYFEDYQNLKFMSRSQIIDYFSSNKDRELPAFVKLKNQLAKEDFQSKPLMCRKCKYVLASHYQVCNHQDFHTLFLCESCSYVACPGDEVPEFEKDEVDIDAEKLQAKKAENEREKTDPQAVVVGYKKKIFYKFPDDPVDTK